MGNSLAIRLPQSVVEALQLKEGDEIEISVAGARDFVVDRDRCRERALEILRNSNWKFPTGWKFDREAANQREDGQGASSRPYRIAKADDPPGVAFIHDRTWSMDPLQCGVLSADHRYTQPVRRRVNPPPVHDARDGRHYQRHPQGVSGGHAGLRSSLQLPGRLRELSHRAGRASRS